MSADPATAIAGQLLLAEVDSTNAEGFRQAPHLAGPLWILAEAQSQGRGRRARPWASPRGNFYATFVQNLAEPPARLGLRSFVAALALHDAFAEVSGLGSAFALKWPNDVLLNGGKISGILLEAQGGCLCIGMGVNLIDAPAATAVEPGAVLPVSLLAETGCRVTPQAFLAALAPAMARREAEFLTSGFGSIRAEWLSRAARIGETITARTGTVSREGVFETIDADGNLVLRMSDGPVAIPAAEVFF